MKNENIAKVLKEQRQKNNLSVNDVQLLLREKSMDISTKTIYSWESGTTQPDADELLVLCEIYHIDHILNTFGYAKRTMSINLSEYEVKMIKYYRMHPEMHEAIHKLLNMD